MNQATPTQGKNTLLEEYVGELGPSPAELAAALGPRRPAPAQAEPSRGAASEPGLASPNLEMVMRIPVTVKIVLGSATMPVASLVKLGRGAVIPLDRRVGEPVDVVVNGRVVARGEVVVVDEATSRFGISLTEVVGPSGGDRASG
jgi:flagellar motor switch protein FliN/FliY